MTVLRCVRKQRLPDPLVFSGAVYQTVWNVVTGRPCAYGIRDYDVGYYDTDLTYEAEDRIIRRVSEALDPPLGPVVEVRNQARVHLWLPALEPGMAAGLPTGRSATCAYAPSVLDTVGWPCSLNPLNVRLWPSVAMAATKYERGGYSAGASCTSRFCVPPSVSTVTAVVPCRRAGSP